MSTRVETRRLFESAAGNQLGRITQAGTIHNSTGNIGKKMRILGSYGLVYILHGGGSVANANGLRKTVRTGDLFLLFPEIGHRYGPAAGDPWDEIYIVFDGSLFDLWRSTGTLNPAACFFHLEPIEYWHRRIADVAAPNLSPLERLCRLQSVLSGAFTDYERDPAAARDEAWLARACSLLDAGIGDELYVGDVARHFGMSLETFRKKFARLSGMPPWRYRITRVIEEACHLIHEGANSAKEIAHRLGFNDEFHFSRRFKQITGRSPTQFRALSVQTRGPKRSVRNTRGK